MAIIRVEKQDNYSIISNTPLNDSRLSWDARGLLVYLLSKPNDWKVIIESLVNESPDGRTVVSSIINELIKYGYMTRHYIRDNGKVCGIEYTVFESPVSGNLKSDKLKTEKLKSENLISEKLNSGNQRLLNTDILLNTERELNTEIAGKPQKTLFVPPTLEEVKAYITEKGYQVNPDKWYDFYTAKNWMIGKNRMRDWRAAIRTWLPDKTAQPDKKLSWAEKKRMELGIKPGGNHADETGDDTEL